MTGSDLGWFVAFVIFCIAQWGSYFDDNSKPVYGRDFGAPVNCRAYIGASVRGYQSGEFTADNVMRGIDRNCGLDGQSWKDRR